MDQTTKQLERVALVDERSKQGEHSDEDINSYKQLAYYTGNQWIAMNKQTKTIVPLPKEDYQVQYVANRIMPSVRTELAKVMRNKLTKKVIPATTEDADVRAARLAEKVVEWLEYDLKLQEIDEEAIMWTLVTRIGFVKPVWNPNKGVIIATEDGKQIKQGDADIEVLNLFELKWDKSASKWEQARWYVHERQRTVEYVKDMYGVEVEAEDGLTQSSVYAGKLASLTSGSTGFIASSVKAVDCVVVKECWEKPSNKYPKGRQITTANGKELYYAEDIGFGEEDTSEREVPIFPLIHINVPGKIIGSSIVEQLMPVQREYNKSRSQTIENKDLMANPKWVAEVGSVDDEIDNRPGSVIWYRKGFAPPVMTQPTSLGSDVDSNIERCLEEFMFISGQQEVSHGATSPGVTAGVAIQLLQEQDDTKLGPTIAKYGRFKQHYLSYLLKMIKYKYDTPRTVTLVGKNKAQEVLEFKGSELTSYDVRMDDMSLTQLSSAAKKQYIIELIQLGVLNPQTDKDLIVRILEVGITDEMYDALEIDVQQAMNENSLWAKGDMSPITREFYNHEVHVAQHNRFRKGMEYEALAPEQRAIIDAHVQEHLEYVMGEMMQPMEQEIDQAKVLGALTPEEQAAVQADPSILDNLG